MGKILVRSQMPSEHDKNISEILIYNLVGSNTGNLLFQNSIMRMLMTSDDVEIVTTKIKNKYTKADIEKINAEYEMFIIPLANAFRISFINELQNMTELIRRLTIPCVVIGVGIQRSLDAKAWDYKYDEAVTEFMHAVLEKSAMVGIRGEVTAEYLTRKGFTPEKDFTVIGCPSLYTYGDNLPVPHLTDLTPKSKTAVNFKAELPKKIYHFLRTEADSFEDNVFVSQVVKEIKALYIGYPYPEAELRKESFPADYPVSFTKGLMKEDRMVGFLDQASWVEWLKGRDFNFGSRIHGDIASILAGTPCFICAGDCRVKELAEYHNIPHIIGSDLTEDMNIIDLYNKADYSALARGHKERVTHYLDFYDKNNIKRITREEMNSEDTPFDRIVGQWNRAGAIRSFSVSTPEEQERRIREYIAVMEEIEEKQQIQQKEIRANFKEYKSTSTRLLKEAKERQKKLEKELAEIKSSKFYKMKVKYDALRGR